MKTSQAIQPVSSEAPVEGEAPFRRWEWVGISGLGLLWLWLRGVSVYHHGWNSDEAQHLHVVWGWTQGLVPYRDFFDNHTPLFHLLFVPLLDLFGERPDIIDLMRWCMAPLIVLIYWCTYRLGAQVFSKRVGVMAALLCAFDRDYFFKVGEFRTDVLWTVFWMTTLVLLTGPRQSRSHRFLAGLAFGATFATSQKTVMLTLVLLFSTFFTYLLARSTERRSAAPFSLPPPARAFTLTFWLGFTLVPGLLLAFFYLERAWSQMGYCLIGHNLLKAADVGRVAGWADIQHLQSLRFWLVVPTAVAGWFILRRCADRDRAGRQVWVLMVGNSYCTVLLGVWTIVSAQDYLPYYPVWLVTVSAGLFWLGRQITRRLTGGWGLQPLLVVVLFGVELGWLVKHIHFSDPQNRFKVEQIREVLSLTRPDEPVLDAKGGSVYRPRAIPYVMETLTRWRLREGMLKNDVAERLVVNRTAVAINLSWFPKATKDFIDQNYLYVGLVHVAGKEVKSDAAATAPFRIEVPNRYVFVDASGLVHGRLDGGRSTARFDVAAGEHSFRPARELNGPCYVLIERAYAAGFTPFNKELQTLEPGRTVTD